MATNPSSGVRSGVCLPIFACPGNVAFRTPAYARLDPRATIEYGVLADELGYESVWVADHLQLGKDGAILEGWTTLAVLAGRTRRVQLGTIHLANALRHPPHVAKMASTLDQISGGRLVFFYDVGWSTPEIQAYGYDVPDTATRLGRMRDGLEVIRRLWTEPSPVTYDGPYYHVTRATCEPRPLQQPHPPIWLGEAGHDALLDATAAMGQGWNSVPATPEELAAKLERLAAACQRAGRDPADLEISFETQVLIAPDRAGLDAILERIETLRHAELAGASDGRFEHLFGARDRSTFDLAREQQRRWLVGTPDEVVDQIRVVQKLGVRHLMLWFLDAPDPRGLRLFAERVRPALR